MIEETPNQNSTPETKGNGNNTDPAESAADADKQEPETRRSLLDHVNLAGETLSGAGKSIRDGVYEGTRKIGSLGGALYSIYSATGNQISKQIQGARNFAAEVTSTGGTIIGLGGGIAGEISLISAGGVPFLVFGGLPLELGAEFGKLCDSLSQSVRGSSPQFMGVKKVSAGFFKKEDVEAILYLPTASDADGCGFVTRKELDLAKDLLQLQKSNPDSPQTAVRYAAIMALQDYKKQLGLALDTPNVTEAIAQ